MKKSNDGGKHCYYRYVLLNSLLCSESHVLLSYVELGVPVLPKLNIREQHLMSPLPDV